jgi:GPH family glycoside/pentoside/hexuronide:cation symporter
MDRPPASLSSLSHAPEVTRPTGLPLKTKLSYGVGDIPIAIRHAALTNFLLFFYTNVVMLSPSLTGMALAIGRVWDGVNDPLVGYLSDHTTSRFGRRRVYLLTSALPLSLSFFLLWSPPLGLGSLGNFVFLAVTYILMDTFFTLYTTPYLALGAELSRDYHERTQIVTIRAIFHNLGAVITVGCLSALVGGTPPAAYENTVTLSSSLPPGALRNGFAMMGALLGGLILFSGLIAFYGSHEVPPLPSRERLSLRALLRDLVGTLQNRPFRIVIFTFAVMTLGGAIHQPLTVYVFRDWLGMEQQLPTIMVLYVVSVMASLGIWTRLARRFGKNRAFQGCILWSVVVLSAFPLLRADMPPTLFYCFIIFAGLGAGGYVLPTAIAADVIDHDELHTGQRREGAFFGLWTLTMKLIAALAIAFVGIALDGIGYVPNQPQSSATLWGLVLLYGPVPAFFLFLSFLVFLRFPLTRESHALIQHQLALRRQ